MKGQPTIEFNEEKFKELVLYLAEESEDDPWFGATKLNKLLFYADFYAYGHFGKPITGAEYQVLQHGPAPKKLLPIRLQMIRDKDLQIRRERVLRFTQQRPIALRKANVSVFSADELSLVNDLLRWLGDRTAGEISELSHAEVCWQLADLNEEIPYTAVFLSSRKPTKWHFERGEQIAAQIAA
ncbi:MAG TPA: Panacea domain-containing protein [Gaiellaceae bacterium]|nr:Panacea domain-containing protein [Gaiellaceae bacterium]